ncbi:MAG TPA: 3-phosphoshikimate 1-carboxyvinyltransferase [Bacillota bacterium]|nr:3-phosphoshikimate 1-carboxyvinyltransferase [Bacillota bacterium]
MDICVSPAVLSGTVNAIPSKSDVHRLLICAFLSGEPLALSMNTLSEDIDTTLSCLAAAGCKIKRESSLLTITPPEDPLLPASLDCRESGSTLRFLIPVMAALGCGARTYFSGSGRLPERPIGELLTVLEEHGIVFSSHKLPFCVSGTLSPGEYRIAGNVSSQYISGLLFALPLLDAPSEIILTSPCESEGYIDMTLSAMERFGVIPTRTPNGFRIDAPVKYVSPGAALPEGDISNAAFFLAAGALGSKVSVKGIDTHSPQSDRAVFGLLKDFGADVQTSGHSVCASQLCRKSISADVSGCPDLLPILAVLAAFGSGTSVFKGAARLRLKESDRLSACFDMITSLGGKAVEAKDSLIVEGTGLKGGTVDCRNDHRLVMAGAIAGAYASGDVILKGAQAVAKSYPSFFDDFKALGGKAYAI